jgi:hypothetical protein
VFNWKENNAELKQELIISVERMPDGRLTHSYENIRKQVEADRVHKHQFMANPTVRQYADQLRSEMIKRRLRHLSLSESRNLSIL